MLDQLRVLSSAELLLSVCSNTLPDACPIVEFRQIQEMFDGGGYSDTCSLTVPASHADAANVTAGNYLLFQDADGYWQEYKIIETERTDGGAQSTIRATGEHAFYELLGEPLNDIRPTTTTATLAVIQALAGTRWSIGTGDDLGSNSTRIYKTDVLTGLKQIADTWGGELRFYMDVTGGAISGRKCDILTRRGSITGKRFEFGKDLTSVVSTVNRQNLATALIGRGKGVEVDGGTETTDPTYGRRLEFDEIEWTIAGGDPADKPLLQNWIGDDTAAAAYGPGGRHIYDYVQFEECTDAEELLLLTYNELQVRKVPQATYDMTVVVLEELSGYDHEAVRLGDTVNVINTAGAVTVTGQARVIKINRNLTDPIDCTVTVGNYVPTLSSASTILQQQQQSILARSGVWDRSNAIQSDPTGGGALQYRIDLLTTELSSSVSGVYTDSNGNIIIENATQTAAVKLGGGILAIANTKSAGEYVWRTFGTGDGFTADEITTGTLNAAIVFAGTLLAASGTFADLVAGIVGAQRIHTGYSEQGEPFFKMYDSDDVLQFAIVSGNVQYGTDIVMSRFVLGDMVCLGTFIS